MASLKKFNGTTWDNAKVRKLGTSTDTLTTLPADLYADGNNATVGLVGNMSQTGTPTPDNPIQPQETGERTENLFDINTIISISKGTIANGIITSSVINANYEGVAINLSLPIAAGTYYVSASIRLVSGEAITMNKLQLTNTGASITTITNPRLSEEFKRYCYKNDISSDRTATQIYFQLGENISNAVIEIKDIIVSNVNADYEPYGYKIGILSASTITPVYLGEVESTRRIKKLVLTGEEEWQNNFGTSLFGTLISNATITGISALSTHYTYNPIQSGLNNGLPNGEFALQTSSPPTALYIKDESYTTVETWRAYLAAQYANGTPVCVWYVLATPETAVVNEPIRKIGDYADTVSGITIPTITGKDTFDVDTSLKPSEVELTYTGWHDADVKEKSENLFNYTTMSSGGSGYLKADGSIASGSSWAYTDYIPCDGTSFVLGKIGGGSAAICFYDSTKTYIYGQAYQTGGAGNLDNIYCTVPQTAKYIRFTYNIEGATAIDLSTIMLNEGSTALPYELYWK